MAIPIKCAYEKGGLDPSSTMGSRSTIKLVSVSESEDAASFLMEYTGVENDRWIWAAGCRLPRFGAGLESCFWLPDRTRSTFSGNGARGNEGEEIRNCKIV